MGIASKQYENLAEIKSVKVGKIQIEWVFGLGFSDHEENYVTLYNKNFS